MLPTGVALMSNPPKHPHKCNHCGHEQTPSGGKRYPFVQHEDADA